MKRILAFMLALLMAFSVISCSQRIEIASETKETKTEEKSDKPAVTAKKEKEENKAAEVNPLHDVTGKFAVGYQKLDITPKYNLPLGGWTTASTRISEKVLDHLFMTFVAFQDAQGQRGLLITVDNLGINTKTAKQLITAYSEVTGTPETNIVMGCTHTHAAPAIDVGSNPYIIKYVHMLLQDGKNAAIEAFNTLDEAEIYTGNKKLSGMNFVRRYVDAAGNYIGNNKSEGAGHETDPDNTLQVIKFDRKNEKDIVIANWQAHATMTGSEKGTNVSADYITGFRDYMEKNTEYAFAMFEGAAGNLAVVSSIGSDNSYKNKQYLEYGAKLGEECVSVLGNMKKAKAGTVRGAQFEVTAEFNEAHKSEGKTRTMKSTVLGAGDVAFIAAPYEMFAQNGMNIKNASPFQMTFICEQANGKNGYLPSGDVYDHGGYEIRTGYFVKGTAEAFQDGFINALKQIH